MVLKTKKIGCECNFSCFFGCTVLLLLKRKFLFFQYIADLRGQTFCYACQPNDEHHQWWFTCRQQRRHSRVCWLSLWASIHSLKHCVRVLKSSILLKSVLNKKGLKYCCRWWRWFCAELTFKRRSNPSCYSWSDWSNGLQSGFWHHVCAWLCIFRILQNGHTFLLVKVIKHSQATSSLTI